MLSSNGFFPMTVTYREEHGRSPISLTKDGRLSQRLVILGSDIASWKTLVLATSRSGSCISTEPFPRLPAADGASPEGRARRRSALYPPANSAPLEMDYSKMEVTEQDLHSLYTWIDDIPLSRPKRNFTRDFSDGVLMAEVMQSYFPKLVEMHNYSSAHGVRQKTYNWETLNRKVLKRLGIEVPQARLDAIVNCEPRAVEGLLKQIREHILRYPAMQRPRSARCVTPDRYGAVFEHGEDANNRLAVGHVAGGQRGNERAHSRCPSQIPRAPSQLSTTPPPVARSVRRPKSSFDVCSSNEKELMIKELQETNELLLAKISKLEQLLTLKDKKIESLVSKLQIPNSIYSNSSPSP